MAPNLEAFLAALSTTLLDGIVMYLICCVAIAEKATLKSCACFIGCIVFLESLFMPLLGTGYSVYPISCALFSPCFSPASPFSSAAPHFGHAQE